MKCSPFSERPEIALTADFHANMYRPRKKYWTAWQKYSSAGKPFCNLLDGICRVDNNSLERVGLLVREEVGKLGMLVVFDLLAYCLSEFFQSLGGCLLAGNGKV